MNENGYIIPAFSAKGDLRLYDDDALAVAMVFHAEDTAAAAAEVAHDIRPI